MKLRAEISDIRYEIDKLAAASKQAANQTAAVNTRLKFDPSNVKLVVERFDDLQKELEASINLSNALKQNQKELEKLRAQEKGDTEESKYNLAEIEKTAAQYARDIQRAEANQHRLNALLSQQNKASEVIRASTQRVQTQYSALIQLTEKWAAQTKKVYGWLKNITIEASETGLELSSLAKRYNTSAEDIQTWNRALQLATGQSELFTNALSVMVKGMSQIASGRGVAFRKALAGIGIAYKDIADLDATKQFEAIIEGLEGVENASRRSAYAQQLLGESGQYIASVLSDGGAALDGYKEKAKAFGIVTNSDAAALAEMNIKIEEARSKFQQAKSTLAVALMPALEIFLDIIAKGIAPALRVVSSILKSIGPVGQGMLIFLGASVIAFNAFIKKLMTAIIMTETFRTKVKGLTVSVTALNASLGVIGIVLMAISALLTVIAAIIRKTREEAEEATETMNEFAETARSMGIIGAEAQVRTEETTTAMTTKTADIYVEINGRGETEISDQSAVLVAQLTADEVQRAWGDLVK